MVAVIELVGGSVATWATASAAEVGRNFKDIHRTDRDVEGQRSRQLNWWATLRPFGQLHQRRKRVGIPRK